MTFWDRTKAKKVDLKVGTDRPTTEDKKWENVLFDERLQDDFSDRVMLVLEGIEIEPVDGVDATEHDVSGYLESGQTAGKPARSLTESTGYPNRLQRRNVDPDDTSIAAQVKRHRAAKSSSSRKAWSLAAAVVVLTGSTLLYAQPTLADMVRSLFAQNSYVDSGMKQVQEAGLVQISDASAVDQGYMLKVNEVIADSTRLIIGIDIFDAKGNAVAGEIQSPDGDFSIFDFERGHFGDVTHRISTGGNLTTSRFEFDFNRSVLTDKLQLTARISQLTLHVGESGPDFSTKKVKGHWTLHVEADLTKAKAQTLLTPIDKTYETPSGVHIHMQGATRTPSGGSLEFTTALTPEAAGRAINGQSGFHLIRYHLEDVQGKMLGESPDMMEMEFSSRRSELDRWSGLTKWFYQFDNFAYDKQQIRFVLDSYVIREKGKASVVLDPAQASANNPVKFEDSGDAFLFKGLTVDSDGVGRIPLGGTFINPNFASDTWIAIDESGKEYRMSLGGSLHGNGNLDDASDAKFVLLGMNKMPKQLTIKRTVVNRQYKDADWSFVIPSTGTNGVIPHK